MRRGDNQERDPQREKECDGSEWVLGGPLVAVDLCRPFAGRICEEEEWGVGIVFVGGNCLERGLSRLFHHLNINSFPII